MIKHLQPIGNSAGIILDKPILDLLKIDMATDIEVETDGDRLILTPIRDAKKSDRKARLAKVQTRVLKNHASTFRKLAK